MALVALGLLLGVHAGQAQEAGGWLVAREALNLRAGPSADAAVLTVLPAGARVEVLGGDEWARVRYGSQTGYAARAYLASAPASGAAPISLNLPVPFYRQLTDV